MPNSEKSSSLPRLISLIQGNERDFPIEARALNVVLFFTAVINLLVQVMVFMLDSPFLSEVLATVFPPIFGGLYLLGRKSILNHSSLSWLFLGVMAIGLTLDWLLVDIASGVILPASIALITLIPIITNQKHSNLAKSIFVALLLIILCIEIHLTSSRSSPIQIELTESYYIDQILTALITAIGASMIISMIMYNYRNQQKEVARLNVELKEMISKISSDNETLKELNATKDTLFSVIAHDLKDPIGAVATLGEMLQSGKGHLDDTKKDFIINSISKSAISTHGLLEDLLLWARAEAGNITPTPATLDLHQQIENIFSLYEAQATAKTITLTNNTSTNTTLLADKAMTHTIIRNLIGNAIKFTPKNGEVIVSSEPIENSFTAIHIHDNGVGIDQQRADNIFTLTPAQGTKGTEDEVSTGLGLKLCKLFTEIQRGQISTTSKESRGTTITFTLPSAS